MNNNQEQTQGGNPLTKLSGIPLPKFSGSGVVTRAGSVVSTLLFLIASVFLQVGPASAAPSTFLVAKNGAVSTLASAADSVQTSLTVTSGQGSRFPSTYPYNLVLGSGVEIVKVTGRSGDIFTIVRAQEGTTASSHAVNDRVALNVTAGYLTELQTAVNTVETGVQTEAGLEAILTDASNVFTNNDTIPASSIGTGLTDSQVADTITVGTGGNLATPPAIGATTPNTGKFTNVNVTGDYQVNGTSLRMEDITDNATPPNGALVYYAGVPFYELISVNLEDHQGTLSEGAVPTPTGSTSWGILWLAENQAYTEVVGTLSHNVADATTAEIHIGSPGANGAMVKDLGDASSGSVNFTLTHSEYDTYKINHYLIVKSSAFPTNGEIRLDIDGRDRPGGSPPSPEGWRETTGVVELLDSGDTSGEIGIRVSGYGYFGDIAKGQVASISSSNILMFDAVTKDVGIINYGSEGALQLGVNQAAAGDEADVVPTLSMEANTRVNVLGRVFKLPVKSDTGDPASPVDGDCYVNTNDNKVRVYVDGAWRDLVTW